MINSNKVEDKIKRLEKKILQLNALNRISSELTKTNDLDVLLNRIIEYAAKIVEGEAASILLFDKDKKELYFKASLGKKSREIKKYKVKIGEGIAGWVAEKGKPLIVNNVDKNEKWKKDFDDATKFTTKSVICVPLFMEEDILGVIEVINKIEEKNFDENDEEILNSFANQVVIALHNANIIGDLHNYFRNTLEILIQAMENESIAPKGHFMKIARFTTQIGNKMGITGKDYKNLYYASILHDIGKIKTKNKIGTDIYSSNNMHPIIGANMLKQIKLFEDIVPIVKYHHENYDGSGFPSGIGGEEIPLASRIIAVVEDYIRILYNININDSLE
ncbi:MAG: GAF domain-containing protein, partial [Candidatus Caldatribacteriota bacterium]|nr:GAF domain-containing protein [Candidatus Caldatribacteriota bacterium]